MKNEPVAWINLDRFKDEALYLADCVSENEVENMGITTPLYTHPVKELTLTRDEIRDVWREFPASFTLTPLTIEFARAILRKAQKK